MQEGTVPLGSTAINSISFSHSISSSHFFSNTFFFFSFFLFPSPFSYAKFQKTGTLALATSDGDVSNFALLTNSLFLPHSSSSSIPPFLFLFSKSGATRPAGCISVRSMITVPLPLHRLGATNHQSERVRKTVWLALAAAVCDNGGGYR
jgi:hypothetical protein